MAVNKVVIRPFAGATTPNGWFLCNGAAISRTTYANLFAVIGTTYGAGDGSTTFLVPNLNGRFIEGAQTGGTPGSGLSFITAEPKSDITFTSDSAGAHDHTGTAPSGGSHSHTVFMHDGSGSSGTPSPFQSDAGTENPITLDQDGDHTHPFSLANLNHVHAHNVTITGGGDSETRPRNVAMHFIINNGQGNIF